MRSGQWATGSRSLVASSLLVFLGVFTSAANADSPPWAPAGAAPLPEATQSLEITRNDAPIYFSPTGSSKRRGAAKLAARLPLIAWHTRESDCNGRWFLVGADAWLCEVHTRLSTWPPGAPPAPPNSPLGLPYAYHFVGADGSFGYASLNLAEEGVPDSQLEPGFAVAIRAMERKSGGELYGLTTHDLWLPMRDLRPAQGSSFEGVVIADAKLNVAWTYEATTPLYSKPNHRLRGAALPRHSRVVIQSRREVWGKAWLEIGAGRWLPASDVREPKAQAAPKQLREGERWLDVDTQSETLVAYVGERPVFATLVSTGKGTKGSELATPVGEHRIWVKLISTDMTNLEDEFASRYYAIEEVPWVMFFDRGYGLHGAFWHDDFGRERSHGCVNLSPKDARFLFDWAGPHLPLGWRAVHPTPHDPGTLVVVR